MKLKAYFLVASVVLFGVAADTKKAKPTEGVNPGDLAPRIQLNEEGKALHFQNQNGHYTLVNFWAAYDAESRARNVLLWSRIKKLNASEEKVTGYSIALDKLPSIFEGTIRADKLEGTNQLHATREIQPEVFKKYQLEKGLRNFLINGEGMIIATNVTPDELTEFCKKI